jgi:hypothetical protein
MNLYTYIYVILSFFFLKNSSLQFDDDDVYFQSLTSQDGYKTFLGTYSSFKKKKVLSTTTANQTI